MDFSTFFSQIFSDLSIWFLVFLLIAFLIGLLSGLWARMGTISRLKASLSTALADKQRMVKEHQEAIEGDTLSQAELARTRHELETLRSASQSFESDQQAMSSQLETMKRDLASQKDLARELGEQVAALKNALEESHAQIAALPAPGTLDELSNVRVELDMAHDELALLRVQLEDGKMENAALQEQVRALSLPMDTPQKAKAPSTDTAPLENAPAGSDIPDDAEVDFINHPIDGADIYDETLIKAKAAAGNMEAFHHDAPLDFFEEDRDLAMRSLEADLVGGEEPESAARGMGGAELPVIEVEDQELVDQAFAAANALLYPVEPTEEAPAEVSPEAAEEPAAEGEVEEDNAAAPHEGLEEPVAIEPVAEEPVAEPVAQEDDNRAEYESRLLYLLRTRLPQAGPEQRDDLKLIAGIGPKLEKTLNGMGIYTYEQVSKFDDEILDLLPDVIGFYAGRARNEDWMSQAAELMEEDEE